MLTKNENGRRVEMSAEEEAEFEAMRAAIPAPVPAVDRVDQLADLLKTKGLVSEADLDAAKVRAK